ncbi:unnamed protein product [Tenebrio molitor]|nr:unnamed protein product [Tenebrio molitor]
MFSRTFRYPHLKLSKTMAPLFTDDIHDVLISLIVKCYQITVNTN